MKVTRILNRGRIVPSTPPPPIIDSGRNSWSTASIVSTIETQSPEPKLDEQVTKKLQQSTATSSTKKIVYGIGIAAVTAVVIGLIVLAIVLSVTSNSATTTTTSTTQEIQPNPFISTKSYK